jgi:hypothetical protein
MAAVVLIMKRARPQEEKERTIALDVESFELWWGIKAGEWKRENAAHKYSIKQSLTRQIVIGKSQKPRSKRDERYRNHKKSTMQRYLRSTQERAWQTLGILGHIYHGFSHSVGGP